MGDEVPARTPIKPPVEGALASSCYRPPMRPFAPQRRTAGLGVPVLASCPHEGRQPGSPGSTANVEVRRGHRRNRWGLFSKITGQPFLCLLLCQPKGREFDIHLGSQTDLHSGLSALLVDSPACTGAKMANTRGESLSQQGCAPLPESSRAACPRPFRLNFSPSPSSRARSVNCDDHAG